jgi:LPPG:FO 2-phospho-L-lactate transferase
MRRLGAPSWFQLGDRDLPTHMRRTELLKSGKSLSQATAEIARAYAVRSTILPMSDDRVETRVETEVGDLAFQEYFVRERHQPRVRGVRFVGADNARPGPGVVEAIGSADAVLLAPSNPITSIGPILAVPGIREALRATKAKIAAVSPIVCGRAVSGPAGELMRSQGLPVSAAGVAQAYVDFLDVLVCDEVDGGVRGEVQRLGVEAQIAKTIMRSASDKARLAEAVLEIVGGLAEARQT